MNIILKRWITVKYDARKLSIKQQKLLANALRIKILNLLEDTPRTSKQTANLLNQSPGNIHYHIQRLYEGGLLKLVETHVVGGIIEKYYQTDDSFREEGNRIPGGIITQLLLRPEEMAELVEEISQLIDNWEQRSLATERNDAGAAEYAVEVGFKKMDMTK